MALRGCVKFSMASREVLMQQLYKRLPSICYKYAVLSIGNKLLKYTLYFLTEGMQHFIEIHTMKQCHRNYKARSLGSMHSDPVFAEKGRAQEQLTVARLVVLGDFFLDRHFIIYSSSSSILPKLTKRPKFPTCRSRSMAFLVLLAAVLVVLSAQAVHVASQPG